MSSGGSTLDQKRTVADVATRIFGSQVVPKHVIGETLTRATSAEAGCDAAALERAVKSGHLPDDYAELAASPLASWIETTFGLATEDETGLLIRQVPRRLREHAAPALSELTGLPVTDCHDAIQRALL